MEDRREKVILASEKALIELEKVSTKMPLSKWSYY